MHRPKVLRAVEHRKRYATTCLRATLRAIAIGVLFTGAACDSTTPRDGATRPDGSTTHDRDSAAEIAQYGKAASAVRRAFGLQPPILLHPRPALFDPLPDSTMSVRFSTYADTTVIRRFAAEDDDYTICATIADGTCNAGTAPYVVLSEMRILDNGDIGVAAMIARSGNGRLRESFYAVRLRHGWTGWRVAGVQDISPRRGR